MQTVTVTAKRLPTTHWYDPFLFVLRSIFVGIPEDPTPYELPCCFAAGTLVQTNHGSRPIETIKLGDMVLSRDEKTGRTAYKPVIGKQLPTVEELYTVEVNVPAGRRKEHIAAFRASAPHPWRTTDGRWVTTTELRHGMRLVRANGAAAVVEWVRDTHYKAITYNLEIADYHTYFVGRDGVWVHNSCNITPKISRQLNARGWTADEIKRAVENGEIGSAINRATGNAASVYGSPGGYVVVDNVTGDVVQVSNRLDPAWIPDPSITFEP